MHDRKTPLILHAEGHSDSLSPLEATRAITKKDGLQLFSEHANFSACLCNNTLTFWAKH